MKKSDKNVLTKKEPKVNPTKKKHLLTLFLILKIQTSLNRTFLTQIFKQSLKQRDFDL